MEERSLEPCLPSSQTAQTFGSPCESRHFVPNWHSNIIDFRGPFSIGAILSSPSDCTAGILQLDKEQHRIRAHHSKCSLTSNWGLSQSPLLPGFSTRTTTSRWPHQQLQQGNREQSLEKCEPRNRPIISLKRSRTIFSPTQLQNLEQEFKKHQYIAGMQRGKLAATLNLTDTQVKVWFQNRRIRYRKQNHKSCQTVQD